MQIDYTKDELLDPYAIRMLKERYLIEGENSPQDGFARAAKAFADDDAHAQRIYNYVSNLWFMFATPVLSNGGTKRGLPISCFLNHVPDSRTGITDHYTENAFLSSVGGGIGGYWGALRPVGSKTSKGSESTGIIPFMKVVDAQMLAFSQGVTRRGSYASYLDISHPEIAEFLEIRKPSGDINRKCLNLHNAVVIPDKFMEIIEYCQMNPGADDSWDLIDPHTGKVTETVSAKALWVKLLETRMATGEPYIMFGDTVNRAMPEFQKRLGLTVNQSNLCVAPETEILTSEGYKVISELEGQEVEVWNGEDFSKTTVVKTGENQELITISMGDNKALTCTKYHKFYLENGDMVEAKDIKPGTPLLVWDTPEGDTVKQTVRAVIETNRRDDTYCFNEPKRHMGVFNGILTGQCSEITLPTNAKRTAVCCLSSVNLEKFDEWKDNEQFIPDLIRFLDNVLEYFIRNAPEELHRAKYSAMRERSLGLGAMGFHAYLQSKGIPIESPMAEGINRRMFSQIKSQAVAESNGLAEEKGPCPDARDCGVMARNAHLLAIAPNASSSILCGNTSPSIEPYRANCFTQKTRSGTNVVKNRYLEKLLEEKGLNNEEVWGSILENDGSVQHLDFLEQHEKDVFKTGPEIDQRWLIEHAAVRQEHICQSQSLNLFFEPTVEKAYLHHVHMLAWKKGVKTLYYLRSDALRKADKVGQMVERQRFEFDLQKDTECLSCEG